MVRKIVLLTVTALALAGMVASVSAQDEGQAESRFRSIAGLWFGYHTVEALNQTGDLEYQVDTRSGDLEFATGIFIDGWKNRWGGVVEASWLNETYEDQLFTDGFFTLDGSVEQQLISAEGFGYFTLIGAKSDKPLDILLGGRVFFTRTKVALLSNQTQFGQVDSSYTVSQNWFDPTIGVRYKTSRVNKFWGAFRADVGGFDVGSKVSWQIRAEGGLRAGGTFDLIFGIRHTDIDYDNGEAGTDFFKHDGSHSTFLIAGLFRFE